MMNMAKRLLFTFFLSVFFVSVVYADGPATVYKVKVKTFEIWNGSSWITVFSGASSAIDIAAGNSGQSAGNFLSGLPVSDGVYTQVRVTPHASFIIKGDDGSGRYTLAANGNDGGCTYTGTASSAAECTVSPPVDPSSSTQDFSATPITVKDGIADKKVRVSFDVSTAVTYNAGADELFPAQPTVTMAVQ
jgi:hypothetical protein